MWLSTAFSAAAFFAWLTIIFVLMQRSAWIALKNFIIARIRANVQDENFFFV